MKHVITSSRMKTLFHTGHIIYPLLIATCSIVHAEARHLYSPEQLEKINHSKNNASQPQISGSISAEVQRDSFYNLQPDRFKVGTNGALIRVFLQRKISPAINHFNAPKIDYYGVIGIGKPEILFNIMFDTSSRDTWIPYIGTIYDNLHYKTGYFCRDYKDCGYYGKYNFNYRNTMLTCFLYKDNFTLYEDIQMDDIHSLITRKFSFPNAFAAADDASDEQFRYKPYDGVVGLAPVVSQGSLGSNFLLAIKEGYNSKLGSNTSRPLNSLMFGLWLNPNQQSHHGGEITFGGVDQSKIASEIQYHKINSYTDWQLDLRTVRLGSMLVSCEAGCNMLLDTGTNSIFGPKQDVEKIHSILRSFHEPASGLYVVDCSTIDELPKFQFVIEYTPYELFPEHYVKIFKYNDIIVCHADIKPSEFSHWRMGLAFIGAYYTVFEMEERSIGFATSHSYTP